MITVTVSLFAAIILLLIAWYNFQSDPVIILTESNDNLIWNYEFPAVTICNYNKISKKAAYEIANQL